MRHETLVTYGLAGWRSIDTRTTGRSKPWGLLNKIHYSDYTHIHPRTPYYLLARTLKSPPHRQIDG